MDKAPVVIDKLKEAKQALENFMQSQGLAGKPEDVANLKGDEARVAFIRARLRKCRRCRPSSTSTQI